MGIFTKIKQQSKEKIEKTERKFVKERFDFLKSHVWSVVLWHDRRIWW